MEHVTFSGKASAGVTIPDEVAAVFGKGRAYMMTLSFLAKDSIPYKNDFAVPEAVYQACREYCSKAEMIGIAF